MSKMKRQLEREEALAQMVQKPELGIGKPRVDIENAWVDNNGKFDYLWGYPVNHAYKHLNGTRCHTSEIIAVRGNLVETKNTVYNVVSWDKDKVAAQQLELF